MPTPATVTATLNDPSATALQGASFVRFRLRNFQGYVPRVAGTAIVCETQLDSYPDVSGNISQTLWKNNQITPSSTFWTIEFWSNGRITSSGNYLINGNTDLDSAAQINAPPVPSTFKLILQNNGAMNSSQVLLNLVGAGITDLGNGAIQIASAPSVSFMAGPGFTTPPYPFNVTGQFPSGDTGLDVIAFHFNFTASLTFNKISFASVSGQSHPHVIFGIYSGLLSASPKQLLWTSGPIDIGAFVSQDQEISVTPFTLAPGDYYLATSTDGSLGGAQVLGVSMNGISIPGSNTNILNHSITQVGKSSNPATSGPLALPASLGTLTPNSGSNGWGYPLVMFYEV